MESSHSHGDCPSLVSSCACGSPSGTQSPSEAHDNHSGAGSSWVQPVFLSVKEAADYLRVSYNSVLGAIKNGSLPAYKVGPRRGTYRIDLAELVAYAESSRTPNTPSRRSGNRKTGSKFKKLDTDRLLKAWKRQGVVQDSPEE